MSSETEKIVSIHIPKTGGTSLRDFFCKLYGDDKIIYYYPEGTGLYRAKDYRLSIANPRIDRLKSLLVAHTQGQKLLNLLIRMRHNKKAPQLTFENLPNDWTILHGHFNSDMLPGNITESAKKVTVIRNPLKRALSQYKFFLTRPDVVGKQPWFFRGMTLEDFLLADHVTNFQTQFLGNDKLENFDHVGITENLSDYKRFFDIYGNIPIGRLNTTDSVILPVKPSQQLIYKFKQLNRQDYLLYDYAKNRTSGDGRVNNPKNIRGKCSSAGPQCI